MTLIHRLKNLWVLSNFTIKKNNEGGVDVFVNEIDKEIEIVKPKMAQIIKRKNQESIINEVLSQE